MTTLDILLRFLDAFLLDYRSLGADHAIIMDFQRQLWWKIGSLHSRVTVVLSFGIYRFSGAPRCLPCPPDGSTLSLITSLYAMDSQGAYPFSLPIPIISNPRYSRTS